jgi:preprotein translocase subunit YajC
MIQKLKKLLLAVPVMSTIILVAESALADLPPGNAITLTEIDGIVRLLAQFLIVMSMVCAVIFIVLSGIMYMMAQADPTRFKNATTRLKHATIGAGVVLATGVIIATVASLVDRTFFCQFGVFGICLIP